MIYSVTGNWGTYLQIQKDFRAVSTLLAVLLILAAAILGGLISYMWAIAPFYATPPSDNVSLAITSANFPLYHANYFDVTVLNPSYSPSGTNVTNIYLKIDGETSLFNVTNTNPVLPVFLDIGASATVRCNFNWGSYAGRNITVSVSPQDGTGALYTVQPAFVKLTASAYFNATETVENFLMIVQNDANSAINLTLTSVSIDTSAVSAVSVILPRVLGKGESVGFLCNYDWQGHATPDVTVGTQEGYTAEVTEQVNASAGLFVNGVQFNETNPGQISVTLSSSPDSTTLVDIANITIAHGNATDVMNETISDPSLPYPLNIGSNVTLNFAWNWADESYRNINIAVTAKTTQGFVSQPATFTTPALVAGRIDQTGFDLNDTGHFTVNVTNLLYSLETINVTEIDFNNNATIISSALVAAGGQATFVCEFNWSSFVGQNANITAQVTYGLNNSLLLLFQTNVPYFRMSNVTFADFPLGNPYMNVTVGNSVFSKTNATIVQIFIQTQNGTQPIDGTISYPKISPQGYPVVAGTEQTITCPWDWSQYVGMNVTVVVQTADGFQASTTLKV
jgi:hypothetical protein